ncbi:MAG: hypothetical protein CMQ79_00780, partial [Gammaproteobacteria bacterium]|nr:hypothetical protein [Gammaproteobacteria bacterium]
CLLEIGSSAREFVTGGVVGSLGHGRAACQLKSQMEARKLCLWQSRRRFEGGEHPTAPTTVAIVARYWLWA